MARSLIITIAAAVALACLVTLVAGQSTAQPDELRFNGNTGDQTVPGGQGGSASDTTIISDGSNVTPANGNQQQQQQQFDQNTTPANGQQRPSQFNGGLDQVMPDFGNSNNDNQQRPPSPFDMFLRPMPFADPFGSGPSPFGGAGPSPFGRGPPHPARLFDHLVRPFRHFDRHFERQFRDLERQASAGEGQDVSYFQRNGVAYVRTCTTKRVQPPTSSDDSAVAPVAPDASSSSSTTTLAPAIASV